MIAEKKIAQTRLTLLQLTERLRNVSEACRHHGISRSQFYEYKWTFQERGLDGLMDTGQLFQRAFPMRYCRKEERKLLLFPLLSRYGGSRFGF